MSAYVRKPRNLFILASTFYALALLQNILLPLGYFSILLTGVLSFLGSLALITAIMLPRLGRAPGQTSSKTNISRK